MSWLTTIFLISCLSLITVKDPINSRFVLFIGMFKKIIFNISGFQPHSVNMHDKTLAFFSPA